MPSVRDLAAKIADALKDSEFRNHPSRIALDKDPQELQRFQWVKYIQLNYDAYHNSPVGKELQAKDRKQFDLLTALCRKLKLPHKVLPADS